MILFPGSLLLLLLYVVDQYAMMSDDEHEIQRLDQLKINTVRWLVSTRNHSLKCMTQFNFGSVRWRVCFRFDIVPWSTWRRMGITSPAKQMVLSICLKRALIKSLPSSRKTVETTVNSRLVGRYGVWVPLNRSRYPRRQKEAAFRA